MIFDVSGINFNRITMSLHFFSGKKDEKTSCTSAAKQLIEWQMRIDKIRVGFHVAVNKSLWVGRELIHGLGR